LLSHHHVHTGRLAKELYLPAKIVVTAQKGGSRVALVGTSGKELLASEVFREPRAKGATVRALKGLLGESVVVEDHTVTVARPGRAAHTNGAAKTASDSGPAKAAAARSRRTRTATVKPRAKRTPAKSAARTSRTTTARRKRA
jgi:hypothetical protein